MLDNTDLRTAQVGLHWIRRHRELHHQPPAPAIERALAHIEQEMSASGPEGVPSQQNWVSTKQAAQRWGCTQRHARRIARHIGRKHGRDWLIPERAL